MYDLIVVRIAIDCMGGDHGLPVTVPAAVQIAQRYADVHLLLVGVEVQVELALTQALAQASKQAKTVQRDQFTIVHASEVVTMEDSVEVALRHKKDSSMRVAARLVKDGQADACVSAGNTGALMAVSRFVLKTLPGIDRPAIATAIPNQLGKGTTMLDLGANVDCTAEHLQQFAIMGSALVQALEGVERPKVALLNIGEEAIKGNEVVKQAAELIRQTNLNFIGNVEGDDIFKGTAHVVVCDGFVGNVALKTAEGIAKMIGGMLKANFMSSFYSKLSALIAKPVLNKFRDQVDNRRYNGAALLGLRGIVFKSHGSADILAYVVAVERAREAVLSQLLEKTVAGIENIRKECSLTDASNARCEDN